MANIEVDFFSQSLLRNCSYKAIIPIEKNDSNLFKTLYLLHGITGDYCDWINNTRIIELVNKYNIAVIMPSGNNSFYVDQKKYGNNYGEFIGEELVEHTRKLFNLSKEREDTFIAGLSMGGYGALRNGLKYNSTFGAIGAMSAALIIDSAIESTEDNEIVFAKRSFYESIFGDLNKLKDSDKDIEYLINRIRNNKENMPRLYVSCGSEDFLIENNRKLKNFLDSNFISHTYEEGKGTHSWDFWNEYIEKILWWLVN